MQVPCASAMRACPPHLPCGRHARMPCTAAKPRGLAHTSVQAEGQAARRTQCGASKRAALMSAAHECGHANPEAVRTQTCRPRDSQLPRSMTRDVPSMWHTAIAAVRLPGGAHCIARRDCRHSRRAHRAMRRRTAEGGRTRHALRGRENTPHVSAVCVRLATGGRMVTGSRQAAVLSWLATGGRIVTPRT